jgi:16S rRNA (uracil1498-N3)-methyltransferase
MRAIWLPLINLDKVHILVNESHHHLVNVVRIKVHDELLLLNGKGLKVKTVVSSISKKEIILKEIEREFVERNFIFDLALGIPKKDALELSLKEATELGFRRIYLVRSAYSQNKVPELERTNKLLISALEQSNSPFVPEVIESTWMNLRWDDYGLKLMMDSQTRPPSRNHGSLDKTSLLLVGPEGGFDPAELSYLHARIGLEILKLPTPILRTPTAVAAGAGCLLQRLMDRK